jgi:hypothetical protein
MFRALLFATVVAGCIASAAISDDKRPAGTAEGSPALDGIWSGAWGGGNRGDGVVFQPVIAEAFIKGDRIELKGFRNANRLEGTFRLDARSRQIHISSADKVGDKSAQQTVSYTYNIKGETLTLTDSDKFAISLNRAPIAPNPLANAQVELAVATGIDDAGDLQVIDQAVLRAGSADETLYQPRSRALKIKTAAIFFVRESSWKKTNVDAVRGSFREPTPVVLAFRNGDPPSEQQFHDLWKEAGSAAPDSDAVLRTISRLMRPGTIVFVLSPSENAPVP